jgi:hypothetical protein
LLYEKKRPTFNAHTAARREFDVVVAWSVDRLGPYHNPDWPLPARDNRQFVWEHRTTFVAIKGRNQSLKSSPITEASPEINRPEKPEYYVWQEGDAPGRAKPGWARRLLRSLPRPAKELLRKMHRLVFRK